ncbi:hypothetical protein AB0D59_18995 [Streptomyces sp. NPDC048417]|uniref:hypothetical protein n=1 Tax=Streptomyces sp. NPDC048417 TaxID=3155387 RepID=UPI00342E716F
MGVTLCALDRDDIPVTESESRLVRRVELVCGGTPAGAAADPMARLSDEAQRAGGT